MRALCARLFQSDAGQRRECVPLAQPLKKLCCFPGSQVLEPVPSSWPCVMNGAGPVPSAASFKDQTERWEMVGAFQP